jgi:energy-coupling factor transporter ATP-binding protein EcfA2
MNNDSPVADNSHFVQTRASAELYAGVRHSGRHTLLLGNPGVGKTSILRHAGLALEREGHICTFLTLRDFQRASELSAETTRLLLDAIAASELIHSLSDHHEWRLDLERRVSPSYRSERGASLNRLFGLLVDVIDSPRLIILLFDGLDEIAEPSEVVRWLEQLTARAPHFVRIVVSSRVNVFSERLQLTNRYNVLAVSPLTISESIEFLHKKLGITADPDSLVFLAKFSQGNPLILSIAALHTEMHGVPITGARTSEHFIQAFIDNILQRLGDQRREGSLTALRLVALFRPITQRFIVQESRVRTDDLRALIEAGLLYETAPGTLDFTHQSFYEYVLNRLVLPDDFCPTSLEFGDEAAERDSRLEGNFIVRPEIEQIFAGRRNIVLGDRGVGKSAIFKRLQGPRFQPSSSTPNSVTHSGPLVIASQLAGDFFPQYNAATADVTSAERFKALWLLYAASLIALKVQEILQPTDPTHRRTLQFAHELLRTTGQSEAIVSESRLSRMKAALRSAIPNAISFSVGPVSVEPKWGEATSFLNSKRELSVIDFLQRVDAMLLSREERMLVVFDQVDEIFKYDRDVQESLIQGLFLAEAFVAQTSALKIVVLLRTDLYEVYDIQEKNKFVSRTSNLSWAREELLDFLLSRLFSNDSLASTKEFLWNEIISRETRLAAGLRIAFPEEIEGTPFVQWLWDGLRNSKGNVSARQIILLLNLARDNSTVNERGGVPIFRVRALIHAMMAVSELSYEEVVSDFRIATSFVRNCRAGRIREFELETVQHLFAPEDGPVAQQVERLERLGFLERKVTQEGSELTYRFFIPILYTRAWDQLS